MRSLILLLLTLCIGFAKTDITLEFLESKPKGLARDFYIWQFLSNEHTSLQDALKAYELIHRKTSKLDSLMSAKGKVSELPRKLYCQRLSFESLKKQDKDCIKSGLNLANVPTMPQKNKDFLLKTFQNDPTYKKRIEILSKPNILTGMLNSDAATFAALYYALRDNQRLQIINQTIKPQALKKLADENNKSFNNMLQKIIVTHDNSYAKFKQSLIGAKITGADSYTLFLLGLNEILHQKPKAALEYFRLSSKNAPTAMQKNRALFWEYSLSHDNKVLENLASSTNVDLYTIYANQKLGVKPSYEVVTDLGKLSPKKPDFDIKDPFQWQLLKDNLSQVKSDKDLEELSKHFTYEDTSAHLAYVLNQLNKFKIHYFITPFSDKLKWKSDHEKAFTYAIAKQESTLLPALVSTSYALGMMQIMPFNVEPFAKSLKRDNITLEDMFNPITALEFGTFYLNDLGREFKHPLFVSYAYNGGPGFLRRTLKTKKFFLKNRNYEPWLSMELIPYKESRDYGFRVLANYIVYQESFGNTINLEEYLKQTLIN
ncbi:murein transglycosylase [Helicobacter cinaedi]|uniref:lytic transglycosylase domain-containing protein n=1 Tax=Helicobacter cinaedi TaxID=213 RepID=UPI001F22F0E8|nr:lytic transglycosylase domain-containing protein [Helicobacter cinaedi]BDB63930.1 murein transglycosylase [Helicobacter cinaedi]